MLTDTERKVLRVLFNLFRFAEAPIPWVSLERFSQRTQEQILEALGGLREKGYIEWEPARERVKVIYTGDRPKW